MAGVPGRDFQVGDRPHWSIEDARRRQEAYESGKRVPTQDDIRAARMKIVDGKYPWWEEEEARAIMAAARSRGMIEPPAAQPVARATTNVPVPVRVVRSTYYASTHDVGPSGGEFLAMVVGTLLFGVVVAGLAWYFSA